MNTDIRLDTSGQTTHVYVGREQVAYFDNTTRRNPNIRLLRSDINLESLQRIVKVIEAHCRYEDWTPHLKGPADG